MDNERPEETNWGVSETNETKLEKFNYKAKQDPLLFRVALLTVASLSILGVTGFLILPIFDAEIPTELNSATMASIGALTGLLIGKNGG